MVDVAREGEAPTKEVQWLYTHNFKKALVDTRIVVMDTKRKCPGKETKQVVTCNNIKINK